MCGRKSFNKKDLRYTQIKVEFRSDGSTQKRGFEFEFEFRKAGGFLGDEEQDTMVEYNDDEIENIEQELQDDEENTTDESDINKIIDNAFN